MKGFEKIKCLLCSRSFLEQSAARQQSTKSGDDEAEVERVEQFAASEIL